MIEFFSSRSLLKEFNTKIVLVLKVPNPTTVRDFKPISCCNVFYKAIAKIIANRIKGVLQNIISNNLAAYIPEIKIGDNILLTQEILKDYHNSNGTPRCAVKVDLMKAFDTLN